MGSAAKPLKHFDWALWSDLVKRSGDHLGPLAEDILSSEKLINAKVKPFALCKSVELLGSFCKQHAQVLKDDANFVALIGPLVEKLSALLGAEGPNLNVANRVVLLNTLQDALSLAKLSSKGNNINLEALSEFLLELKKSPSQKICTRCNNCLSLLAALDSNQPGPGTGKEETTKESRGRRRRGRCCPPDPQGPEKTK